MHRRLTFVFGTIKHLDGILGDQLVDKEPGLLDNDGEQNQFEELELNQLIRQSQRVLEATSRLRVFHELLMSSQYLLVTARFPIGAVLQLTLRYFHHLVLHEVAEGRCVRHAARVDRRADVVVRLAVRGR